jgi:hypothetical protein
MPIITTVALTALLTNLATKGLEKAFETGGEKITEGALIWFKSLFFKDDEPKSIMKELQQAPDDKELLSKAVAIIENSVEDEPKHLEFINEILEKIPTVTNNIANSKNVNTGNVNTGGGDFRIGDN